MRAVMKKIENDYSLTTELLAMWRMELLRAGNIFGENITAATIPGWKSSVSSRSALSARLSPALLARRFLVQYWPLLPEKHESYIINILFPLLDDAITGKGNVSVSSLYRGAVSAGKAVEREHNYSQYLIYILLSASGILLTAIVMEKLI